MKPAADSMPNAKRILPQVGMPFLVFRVASK